MVCDGVSHSSASFQFAPHIEAPFDHVLQAKPHKSAKRRCLSFLVILFSSAVVLFIIASVALILTQKPVNFDDIGGFTYGDSVSHGNSSYKFHARKLANNKYLSHSISDVVYTTPKTAFAFRWLHDDNIIIKDNTDYWKIDTNKADLYGSRKHWINPGQIRSKDRHSEILFNSNSKYIAFGRTSSQGFRHSRKCIYEIAQFENGNLRNFVPVGPSGTSNDALQLLEWNPAFGARDLVYVFENNIYYQENPEAPAMPLTTSGSDFRYHGVADWLYEEEILNDAKALWWSKSGDYLAYALFDDTNVSKVILPFYSQKPYPTYHSIAYPKAGDTHQPAVFLWIWNKQLNTTQMILPPDDLVATSAIDYYLFSAQWIQLEGSESEFSDYLIVVWANRNQNIVYITVCQYGIPCRVLKKIEFAMNSMEMWAEPTNFKAEFFSKTGFFMLLPHEYSDGNVYDHIAHIEVTKEGKYFPESGYHGGAYDVKEIVGYDRDRDEVFFTASSQPIGEKHLYRVSYAAAEDNIAPQCITCLIENCKTVEVNFSPSGKQMVVFCDSAYQDTVAYLKKTQNILHHWIINDGPPSPPGFSPPWDLPTIKFDSVPLKSGIEAHVSMILPPNFNSKYTYPVLLHLYAGPNTNTVVNSTPMPLLTYLAAIRQYVVISIDGRGSGNRGWKIRSPLYKNLGGPEIDDQINALRYLIQKYPFMDSEKVAAFGWSYGGFASSHIVEKDGGSVVKCAMAVAPVVDFRFYDSAYTERYMLQPNENLKGYEATSLLNSTAIQQFKNVKFFLAHGEADDNVHYQNSALFSRALQENSIHFTQLVYANQEHSLKNTRMHLYKEIDNFLYEDCFQLNYY